MSSVDEPKPYTKPNFDDWDEIVDRIGDLGPKAVAAVLWPAGAPVVLAPGARPFLITNVN